MFSQYIIEFDVYYIVFDINRKSLMAKLKLYACCFDVVMTFKDIFNYISFDKLIYLKIMVSEVIKKNIRLSFWLLEHKVQ